MNPENIARIDIYLLLESAGFVIQDMHDFDRTAATGVVVREFVMRDSTRADYLIFIDAKEIYYMDLRDEILRSRRIFAFHRPEFLRTLLHSSGTLRNNLKKGF